VPSLVTGTASAPSDETMFRCVPAGPGYLIGMSEMARAMTSCWICSVPSKMS
jgi:hypothetical protein